MHETQLEQEVRRQAMLEVMGLEVWLPRQQLPHAALTPEWLLNWQPQQSSQPERTAVAQTPVQPQAEPSKPEPVRASATSSLEQVRQSLSTAAVSSPAPVAVEPIAAPEKVAPVAATIPSFSMQLFRSSCCLLLVDLPLGERLQTSDPEFQLLQDILHAATLPPAQQLRRGEPIRWPLLTIGQLVGAQDEQAARACVRDLLEFEASHQPISFIWLLGEQAVRFANVEHEQDSDYFALTAFPSAIRCWNLPSLEQIMQRKELKPQLWLQLQKLMPHWAKDD